MIEWYGGVYPSMSTPHQSEIKMIKKKKKMISSIPININAIAFCLVSLNKFATAFFELSKRLVI